LYLSQGAGIDEQTARCFPGLVNVSVNSSIPIELGWFAAAGLRGVALNDRSVSDWHVLASMGLERLSLIWTAIPLEHLPRSLKWLSITGIGPLSAKKLHPVWMLPGLEQLRLANVSLKTLSGVSKLERLTTIDIWETKSFAGLNLCPRLQTLHSVSAVCPPLSTLSQIGTLRNLSLQARTPPSDLEEISNFVDLEELTLNFGDIHGLADVRSLAFLRPLRKLRTLELHRIRLADRDVGPIEELHQLRVVKISGDFGPGANRLIRSERGRDITIAEVAPGPKTGVGPVTPRLVADKWTVFQDLSELVGGKNNHDAERAIRRRLKTDAPDLVARIEFDSEADAFGARAKSREDIYRLAAIIKSMSNAR
jgi:hypothetical protein